MESHRQNCKNKLVQRYGFEAAAAQIQELYLDGKKDEAAAAIPGELIDAVSLAGPPDVVRERITAFRIAGDRDPMIIRPIGPWPPRSGSPSFGRSPSSRLEHAAELIDGRGPRAAEVLPGRIRPARPRVPNAGARPAPRGARAHRCL